MPGFSLPGAQGRAPRPSKVEPSFVGPRPPLATCEPRGGEKRAAAIHTRGALDCSYRLFGHPTKLARWGGVLNDHDHGRLPAENHVRRNARLRRPRCADLLPRSSLQPPTTMSADRWAEVSGTAPCRCGAANHRVRRLPDQGSRLRRNQHQRRAPSGASPRHRQRSRDGDASQNGLLQPIVLRPRPSGAPGYWLEKRS